MVAIKKYLKILTNIYPNFFLIFPYKIPKMMKYQNFTYEIHNFQCSKHSKNEKFVKNGACFKYFFHFFYIFI